MLTESEHLSLRKKYNPDGSNLRKAQLRMLEMLVYTDKLCRENHLSYWLEGGTLLGAVRHKGFIPWDDDTDIYMLADDLKKLKKIMLQNEHPDFIWQDHDTDSNEFRFWAALRDIKSEFHPILKIEKIKKCGGPQVDLFPVETNILRLPNKLVIEINGKFLTLIEKYSKSDIPVLLTKIWHSFVIYILFPLFRLFGKYFGNRNEYSNSYGACWGYYPKSWIFPLCEVEFEGHSFFAPCDYEKYLKKKYGEDCFEMPTSDKIITHT